MNKNVLKTVLNGDFNNNESITVVIISNDDFNVRDELLLKDDFRIAGVEGSSVDIRFRSDGSVKRFNVEEVDGFRDRISSFIGTLGWIDGNNAPDEFARCRVEVVDDIFRSTYSSLKESYIQDTGMLVGDEKYNPYFAYIGKYNEGYLDLNSKDIMSTFSVVTILKLKLIDIYC